MELETIQPTILLLPMHLGVWSQFPVFWQVLVRDPLTENPETHIKKASVSKW